MHQDEKTKNMGYSDHQLDDLKHEGIGTLQGGLAMNRLLLLSDGVLGDA
jgi:hypothetical protein